MHQMMKVVSCGDLMQVPSQKTEGGMLSKRQIVLQLVGSKYEDTFVGTMLGNLALCQFYPDDVVWASLRFNTREYGGQIYQDITVNELIKLN